VYGPVNAPSSENDPTQPISPYGVSKLAGEQLCLAYAKRPAGMLSVTALRYFTVYGPRQRPDMAIGRILAAALTGKQYTIFGDGTQRREFTYVTDVVDATMAAARVDVPAAVVNVGGGSSVSLIDVIGMAQQITGNPVPLTAVTAQAGDVPATAADITLARLLLGYQPSTDLLTGMTGHAQWLRELPADLLRTYAPPPTTTETEEAPACSS
jgi:nucleoside-diphosphate-sugar epimerase